jgi:hypothetical protein
MLTCRTLLVICLLGLSTPALASGPLDELIGFSDPYNCIPNKRFETLLDSVLRWEEFGDSYKGRLAPPRVPAAFRRQVGKPTLSVSGNKYVATIPLRGTWQGLPLQSLVVIQWVESEDLFYLVFDASPEGVLAAANRAGLSIPPSGETIRDDEGVLSTYMGVRPYDGGVVIYCGLG